MQPSVAHQTSLQFGSQDVSLVAYGSERYGPMLLASQTNVLTSEFFYGKEMNTAST